MKKTKLLMVFIVLQSYSCHGILTEEDRMKRLNKIRNKFLFSGDCFVNRKMILRPTLTLETIRKLKLKLKWIAFSADARIALSRCAPGEPASSMDPMVNSSSETPNPSWGGKIILNLGQKNRVNYYEISLCKKKILIAGEEKQVCNVTLSEFTPGDKEGERRNGSGLHQLFCLSQGRLSLQNGFAFGHCGESSSDELKAWKDLVSMDDSSSKTLVMALVGGLTGAMVLCTIGCLVGRTLLEKKREKEGYYQGRRGSNISSSGKTKEIEV